MPDKPEIDPKLTPVLEPNFDKQNVEAPAWINELWQNGAHASVLIEIERRCEKDGWGSGFFVDKDGYIATANHLVKNTTGLTVITFDGKKYNAEVVSTNPSEDLAVLRLKSRKTPESCRALPIGETNQLSVDQTLVNIGHPRGVAMPHISVGKFEQLCRELEATVPSVTGNSGGSVLDTSGRVVGVCCGAVYHSGKKNTPRGIWIGDKPPSEPDVYSKDSSTYIAPAESLSLLLARTAPKFSVTRYNTGWSGEHLDWLNRSPLNPAIDAVGLGAASYGGGRLLLNYRGAALGSGIAGGIMLGRDGYHLYNSPAHETFQGRLALAADATTLVGSIVRARYAKVGTALVSLGVLGRLGTEFVPTGVRLHIDE
jgi:hypothetical protein